MRNKILLAIVGLLVVILIVVIYHEKKTNYYFPMPSAVKNDDEKVKNARAFLTYCVQTVIKIGSSLLGMEMPTKM